MATKNYLDHFENIDTEEKAYWLGFLYADGYISYKENKIELALAEKDYEHVAKFKKFIGLDNRICYKAAVKAYRFSFRSDKMKNDLIKQGCTPRKSLTLVFPSEEQVPRYLIKHFMRGYFDGDGWFTNTRASEQVGVIGTLSFLEDWKSILLEKINLQTKSKFFNVHRENGAKRFMFSQKEDVTNFLNWIYKDSKIYLDRKYEHYLDFLQNGFYNVVNKDAVH
jgi:mobile intron protein